MEKIEDCFCFLLGKTFHKVSQKGKERLSNFGITPVQFTILHLLWEKEGQKSIDIAKRLHLDGSTITPILDRLVQNGLIERRHDPKDRRINLIYLTEKGKELETPLNNTMDEVNHSVIEGFDEEEIKVFKKMLTKLGLNQEN
ncbi:MarR family transcriptional regulator [Robertmurraya sp. DFI.2.37]|uniref:MarR family winged helix-turn-helix transcriptional regulator n=1 Tax=Robertmurraya TaxID=2837507 RepID=UPI0010F5CFA2|nr:MULTISPECIES: MarR family transcriptional regulator [Robertmurraya]MDF1510351.1 MarR family transcriptional regulator [Robertmurraya sp. DFI.2.37]